MLLLLKKWKCVQYRFFVDSLFILSAEAQLFLSGWLFFKPKKALTQQRQEKTKVVFMFWLKPDEFVLIKKRAKARSY